MYTIEAGRLMSPSTTYYNSFRSPKVYLTEKGKETKRTTRMSFFQPFIIGVIDVFN